MNTLKNCTRYFGCKLRRFFTTCCLRIPNQQLEGQSTSECSMATRLLTGGCIAFALFASSNGYFAFCLQTIKGHHDLAALTLAAERRQAVRFHRHSPSVHQSVRPNISILPIGTFRALAIQPETDEMQEADRPSKLVWSLSSSAFTLSIMLL